MRQPDPRKSTFMFACGKKGSGKSHWCREWWDAYPYDRLVIDPTGDVADDLAAEGQRFVRFDPQVIPVRLPVPGEGEERVTCVYVPDMGSATALDDIDRVIGLAMRGRDKRAMLWIDEFGQVTRANKTPPNCRRALHQGRHHNLTLMLAAPRPIDVDPLGIAQADLVACFRMPNPADRRRVADNIGFPPAEFDTANAQLAGHEYLLYDHEGDTLYHMPPLPPRRRGRNVYPPVPA